MCVKEFTCYYYLNILIYSKSFLLQWSLNRMITNICAQDPHQAFFLYASLAEHPFVCDQQQLRQSKELHLTLVFVDLIFRDKLQWVAKNSKAWLPFFWTIIQKLMPESIATLATKNLIGCKSFHHFGYTVFTDGLSEGRPGRGMGIFGPAWKQWMSTLRASIYSRFKVFFIHLLPEKRTKRHSVLKELL